MLRSPFARVHAEATSCSGVKAAGVTVLIFVLALALWPGPLGERPDPSMRTCTETAWHGSGTSCSDGSQLAKVELGFSLKQCKAACLADPDCQGGYHADGQRDKSKLLQRYDSACYLLGVGGADQQPCSVPNTQPATGFECVLPDCTAEPEVCARAMEPALAFHQLAARAALFLATAASAALVMRRSTRREKDKEAGATPAVVVQALPLRTVTSEEPVRQCPICLEDMETGSAVRTLPCDHFYHAACVEGWLKEKNSCPMCRQEMPLVVDL